MRALLAILLLVAGCRSARYSTQPVGEEFEIVRREPPASIADVTDEECVRDPDVVAPAPMYHQEKDELVSFASCVPPGRVAGTPRDPQDFRRQGGSCNCCRTMGSCKCLHCVSEAGAECYCDQGEPKCLCGIDMGGCRCGHCAGREGVGVCPCDHSKTRAELERRGGLPASR